MAEKAAEPKVTVGKTLYADGYSSGMYLTKASSPIKRDLLENKLNQMIDCLDGNIDDAPPLDADGNFSRAWVTRKTSK